MVYRRVLDKLIILIISLALVFSAVSCGEASTSDVDQTTSGTSSSYHENTNQNPGKWYIIKDMSFAFKVPKNLKIKRADKKGSYTGQNDRMKIAIKRWNRVSLNKLKSLKSLVKKYTGHKVKAIRRGGRRMVKVLGYKKKIRYYVMAKNGDTYVFTITPNKEKHPKLKLKDIKKETSAIEKSFRSPKRVPKGADKVSISRSKFPKPDYLVLVNSFHKIPKGWSDKVDYVRAVNSRGNTVKVERKAYKEYLKLKEDLEKNDKIHIDIDYGLRTVKEQKELIKEYTEMYGASYANRIAARPGYSEHHTGLAIDIYLIIKGKNIYLNEEMEKYPKTWEKIHSKLAKYGFILRYPKNTSYPYEPWHIRYVGKKDAKNIMSVPGLTLENYLLRR